ncbi:MAG: MFS transporter [Thermoplasmata archaeon]|nr:MFS transporter [Thermoplasmata archaeon]
MNDDSPTVGAPTRRRDLWRNRSFRWFFASEFVGNTGYALYAVAVVWLAVERTGSYALAGAVLGLEFGIYALSFLIGPLVDRARNLRQVAILGYAGQALLATGLGLLSRTDALTPPVLLAFVAGLSIVWDFTWTATNALLPAIVPGDSLFLANGLTGSSGGGNQLLGAAVGAVLIGLSGPSTALLLYGAFNVAALVALLPLHTGDRVGGPQPFLRELAAGWKYLAGGPGRPLLQVAAFGALQGFISGAPPLLIAIDARSGFPDSPAIYGLFATMLALGGLVGSLALAASAPRQRLGTFLLLTAGGEGLLLLAVAIAGPITVVVAGLWAAVGAAEAVYFSAILVYLQATTPTPLLGRTFTNTYFFRGTARATGAVGIGAAALALGFGSLTIALALGLFGLAAGTALALPAVRRLAF